MNVVITKNKEFDWDITVYENNKPVKTAWAFNRDQAIGKATILAEFYRDDNGQTASIIINESA
jgi:hypothetical protein